MADGFGIGSARKPEVSGLERVGLALSNLGAGLAGQPFPSIPYMAAKRQERLQTIQELGGTFALMKGAQEILRGTSAEGRPQMIDDLSKAMEQAIPGIGPTARTFLEGDSTLPENLQKFLKYDEVGEQIYKTQGQEPWLKHISDPKVMKPIQLRIDAEHIAADREQLEALMAELQKTQPKRLKERGEAGYMPSEIAEMNQYATGPPGAEGATMLSQDQLDRMERNAGAYGLVSPETAEEITAAGLKAKEKAKFEKPGKPGTLVTLISPGTEGQQEVRTLRQASPEVDSLLARNWIKVPHGRTPAEAALTPSGINQRIKIIEDTEFNARNFLKMAAKTINLFKDRPEILGAVGTLSQVSAEVQMQAVGFARVFDVKWYRGEGDDKYAVEITPEELRRVAEERYGHQVDSLLDRMGYVGQAHARVKSAVVGLAFAAAAVQGSVGRAVSDRDVERFTKRIGQSADPRIFEATLRDVMDFVIDSYESAHKVYGKRIPENLQTPVSDLWAEEVAPFGLERATPRVPGGPTSSTFRMDKPPEQYSVEQILDASPNLAEALRHNYGRLSEEQQRALFDVLGKHGMLVIK
jgi:hypothetical protein